MSERREWSVEEYPPRVGHGMQSGKTGSGIRVTHCPSGLSETCTKYRSQHQNRNHCIRRIKQALEERQARPLLPVKFDDDAILSKYNLEPKP